MDDHPEMIENNQTNLTNFSQHFFGAIILGFLVLAGLWVFNQAEELFSLVQNSPMFSSLDVDNQVLIQVVVVLGGLLIYWGIFLWVVKKINDYFEFELIKIWLRREDFRNLSSLFGTGLGAIFIYLLFNFIQTIFAY